jgi:hypothetical protein
MNPEKPDEPDEDFMSLTLRGSEFKTPQEKKRLSYAKDHRSNYGERGSCIPKRKRSYARIVRRSQNQPLDTLKTEPSDESLTTTELRVRVAKRKKKGWKKYPDIPLGQHVINRKRYRAEMEAAGGRRAAKRKALT